MQMKIAIAKLLKKYRVELADATPRKIRLAKNAFVIQSDVPLVFKLIKDELIL
jgi:hypothetical protein